MRCGWSGSSTQARSVASRRSRAAGFSPASGASTRWASSAPSSGAAWTSSASRCWSASTSASASRTLSCWSARTARARASERCASVQATAGPTAAGAARASSRRRPGPSGSPTKATSWAASVRASASAGGVGLVVGGGGERVGGERAGPLGLGHERDEPIGQPPGRALGLGADALGCGGRVGGQQAREGAEAALALARGARLLGGVALDRLGGDRVDVGEDRLADVVERLGGQPAGRAGIDDAPPRHARADAVRGQERVEAAAGARLAAAERDVDLALAVARAARSLEPVDEAAQRDLDAAAHVAPEGAGQWAGVFGDLGANRGDDLLCRAVERGAQRF